MLLYKYVPFESGKKILETTTIGFSKPDFLNDPFDLPSYPPVEYIEPINELARKVYAQSMLRRLKMDYDWAQNTGILSLTRTPTNPLMWAHYALGHTGMVIGIDMVWAGLADPAKNLIPAQFGGVVYVSRRSLEPFLSTPTTGLAIGETHHFPIEHYERLQRLFLHKASYWSYEEEVRVVKCLKGISEKNDTNESGTFSVIQQNGRDLYTLQLPKGCIKQVYFGFRSDDKVADPLYHQILAAYPELQAYECRLDGGTFSVNYDTYTAIANGYPE